MGCDIHYAVQYSLNGQYRTMAFEDDLFGRDSRAFAFLANVRNAWGITPISEPRGLPDGYDDCEDDYVGDHHQSWLTVQELVEFDYTKPCLADGTAYVLFLGQSYFRALGKLREAGATRIVFGFDS